VLCASYTSEERSCNRLRIRRLIIRNCFHLLSLVASWVGFRQTSLATSGEISRLVADQLILHGIYSRKVKLLFVARFLATDRSLGLGGIATRFAILAALRGRLLVVLLLALPSERLLVATILPFAASPQTATLLVLAGRQVLLLILDPAILEPDLHLLLRQPQIRRDLDAAQSRQVHVRGEFALQFQ